MGHCRLCLGDSPVVYFNIEHIKEKITAVFSFEISSHPDLPEVICSSCVDTVSNFYDYFCLVHQNQLKLYCQIEAKASDIEIVKQEIPTGLPGDNEDERSESEPMEDDDTLLEVKEVDGKWAPENEIDHKPSELILDDPVETIDLDDDDGDDDLELIEEDESSQEGEDDNDEEWLPEDEINNDSSDRVSPFEHQTGNSWKLDKNVIFRELQMVCNICQKDQGSYSNLELHLKIEHDRPCYVSCCEQKLYPEPIILHHFERHIPIIKTKKQIVDDNEQLRSLPEDELLQSNTKQHHPWKFENNRIYRQLNLKCEICRVELFTYQSLKAHVEKYHARQCYIFCCCLSFDSEKAILKHFECHRPEVQSKKADFIQNDFKKPNIFATVLTDFRKDLEGFEPMPNMVLVLRGNLIEKKKLNDVIDHLVQIHFPLDCEQCGEKFDSLSDRQQHFKRSHNPEKHYVACCGCRFFDRIHMLRHLNRHLKVEDNGALCEAIPETNERVWLTMEACRDELKKAGFIPPISLASVTSAEQVNQLRQMQDFLIAKYLPLDCEVCDAYLCSYPERRQHFRTNHPKLQHYIECCSLKMDRKRSLMIHLLRHRNNPDLQTSAKVEYTDAKKAREYATIESFYKMDCSLCPYKGNSYSDLRTHFKKFHREVAFFISCCKKNFSRKQDILAHVATHQKPTFKCVECKKVFPTEQELEDHADNTHRGELNRKFKCDQCPRSFPEKYKLQAHAYKHKLAKCDICGIELNQTSLKRHRESRHKMGDAINCPYCPRVFYTPTKFYAHSRKVHEKDPEKTAYSKSKKVKKNPKKPALPK